MQDAKLSFAQFQGANLAFAQIQGTNLYRAQMQGATLSEAQMQVADLYGAGMQGSNLKNVRLYKTKLENALLSWSDWRREEIQSPISDESGKDNSHNKQEPTDHQYLDQVPGKERLIHVRHDGIFGKANDPEQFELNRAKWLAENVLCTDLHILNGLSYSAIHSFQSPLMAKIFIETISKEKSCQEITDNLPDADKKRYQSSVYNLNKYIAEEEEKKGTKPIP